MPIVHVPEPGLRQKTRKVKKIDASIQKLIDDMIETMYDAPGVGLAANQVGVPLRICVIDCPESSPGLVVLINPEIVRRSGARQCEEGCLSLPGYKGEIQRSEKVVVKGLNRDGRPVRYHATELFAEAIEHEVDHLNGVLYFDYLDTIESLVPVSRAEDQPRAADDNAGSSTAEDGAEEGTVLPRGG
jgi:peptide deformylase